VVLLGVVLLLSPRAMLAHAILLQSTPAAHSTVHGPHLNVYLRFNSRLDGGRSKLLLNAADGHEVPLSSQSQKAASDLGAVADGVRPGHYVLHWIALASDGHITRGEIPFDVD
jgi:methionine-rich copper-binding protein CopC